MKLRKVPRLNRLRIEQGRQSPSAKQFLLYSHIVLIFHKLSYLNGSFLRLLSPLKADLFSWFLPETWELNIILEILLILSKIKIL